MDAQIFIAEPIKWNKGVKLFPPKIKEILGKEDYPIFASMFIQSQEDIWDMIAEKDNQEIGAQIVGAPTPYEMFMINCYTSPEFKEKAIDAFMYFTHEIVRIIPENKTILFCNDIETVTDPQKLRMIDNDDEFFDFQNAIRRLLNLKECAPPEYDINPKIARMKALSRKRDRIKSQKGNENGLKLSTMLVALCCMGIGLNPLNIGEITLSAASEIFAMMQEKEKYETDIKIMTAGFGTKKKITPKYWVRNKDKEN